MTGKINKKTLNEPDAFLTTSDHAFAWIQRHARTMGIVTGVVAVLAVAWATYGFIQNRTEKQAVEALYAPEAELKTAETKVRDERAAKMKETTGLSAKAKTEVKPESLRPVDFAKDYAPSVEKIKVEINRFSGTKAALVSAMSLSSFLLEQKQYEEALKVLNLAKYQPSASDVIAGLLYLQKGVTLIENKKFEEATKSYQAILDSAGLGIFHPEALLKLGVAQELKGDADKARQTYEKLGREFPNSDESSSAQQYLRLLELKSRQG